MSEQTDILSLPLIQDSQAQKHITHNEAIADLDVLVQLSVLSRSLAAPPLEPAAGDRYIVAEGATGDWEGGEGAIAVFRDEIWAFLWPVSGWGCFLMDEGRSAVWTGNRWIAAHSLSPNLGTTGEASKFGGSLGVASGSNNIGVIGPTAFYADTPVTLTANGGDFAGGVVRIAIHCLICTVPDANE